MFAGGWLLATPVLYAFGQAAPARSKAIEIERVDALVDVAVDEEAADTQPRLAFNSQGPYGLPSRRLHSARRAACTPPGATRSFTFGDCPGGTRKAWSASSMRTSFPRLTKERTLRWQIARGLRGTIFSLAVSPRGNRVAVGGYGPWENSLGEVARLDPRDGSLSAVELSSNRNSVLALGYTSDGAWTAISDAYGQLETLGRRRQGAENDSPPRGDRRTVIGRWRSSATATSPRLLLPVCSTTPAAR